MWSTAWASAAGKPSIALDLAAHAVVAERDLAEQLAGVGELDGLAGPGVGLDLADVVQQRAGDRHVAVDPGEGGGQRAHALGHRQAVLEQPVAVGLVVVLGRRAPRASAADLGAAGRAAGRAARAGAGAAPCRRAPRRSAAICSYGIGGPSVRSAEVVLALGGRPQRADRDARAVALVAREKRPATRTTAPAHADRLGVLDAVPDDRLDGPAEVAELELQERLAVALLAQRASAHDEDRVDLLAVGEVAHEAAFAVVSVGLLHRMLPR